MDGFRILLGLVLFVWVSRWSESTPALPIKKFTSEMYLMKIDADGASLQTLYYYFGKSSLSVV